MDKNAYGTLPPPVYFQKPQETQHRSKLPLIGLLLCVGLLSVVLIMVIVQHNTLNSLENSLDMYQQIILAKAASEPTAAAAKGGKMFQHTGKMCIKGSQCPSNVCNRITGAMHCSPVDMSKKSGGSKCSKDKDCQSNQCKGGFLGFGKKCASVDWSRDPSEAGNNSEEN